MIVILCISTNAWSCVSTTTVLERTDLSASKFILCCSFIVNGYFLPFTLGNHCIVLPFLDTV